MAEDNLERHEVDRLIKELAAARQKLIVTKQPVSAAPPAAASTPPSAVVTQLPPVTAPVSPPVRQKTFISAINLSQVDQPEAVVSLPRRPSGVLARVMRLRSSIAAVGWRMPEVPLQLQDLLARLGSATREVTQVRMCVGLGVMLAIAMPYWPYPKVCTWWLLLYMFAVAMVIIAGVWAARLTWRTRLGIAHTVALIVVLWGITLGAEETLPRIGYAKTDAVWICP